MQEALRQPRGLVLLAAAALALGGCPDIPTGGSPDVVGSPDGADADDDAFVPLRLDRVRASTGEPAGGERVAVLGDGLQPGAQVFFGGELATSVLVLDATRLNCDVPPHPPGLVDVRVTLPDGQTATLPEAYLYRGPLRLDTVTPQVGPRAGGIGITVKGEGFDDATRVLIGGRLLEDAELIDDRTLTGTLPARLKGRPGEVDVQVSDGFEQRTLRRGFRYLDDLEVTWLTPASGGAEGGTIVTLYGSGLSPDTVVSVGGTVAEIVQPGEGGVLTLRVPPADPGAVDLTLVNEEQSLVLARAFTYTDAGLPGLTLANAWPLTGPASGGTQVALTVTGLPPLQDDVGIAFGGAPATVLEYRPTQGQVVVVAPAGAAGPAPITVTAGGVSVTRADLFTWLEDLRVDGVTPSVGKPAGGGTIVLEGEGFSATTRVIFGGTEALSTKLTSPSELRVEVPPGVPGRVDLRLVDGARKALVPAGFEYRDDGPPRLLSVSPPDGAQSGGRLVRLHGTGLRGADPAALFGAEAAADVVVVDDATVHVRAPRGEVGSVVVDAGDAGRLAMAYTYFDPTSEYGGTDGGPIPEALNVTVLDGSTREGVPQAYVILWDDLATPFQGVTDDRGQLTLSDELFGPPQMVTAGKDLYTTASVVDFDARNVTLLLVPLVSSPPSPGGGGNPPAPLPDGRLAGQVTGFDKYIIPPVGGCEAKLEGGVIAPGSPLCQPCEGDAECGGEGARCVLLGDQGKRCTTACETSADCGSGFVCAGVGFGAVQCVPAPGQRTARCATTIPDIFTPRDSGPSVFTNGQIVYELDTPPGEHAVLCFGGYMDPDTGEFVPVMMGVRRHVFTLPGDLVAQQDVRLDIPLTRTLRIRLDDPPKGEGAARNYELDVFLDLGSDGVFPMPSRGVGVEQDLFELEGFPVAFEESLYDASYTLFAVAETDATREGFSSNASYVHMTGITAITDDAVFEVVPDGARVTSTGIVHDVYAMHGPGGGGPVWAVGSEGRIMVWDGTWWALQQSPVKAPLRAVWGRAVDDAWAAGDGGALVRWNGLVWKAVPALPGLEGASWWAMTGEGGTVWLAGDKGVWRVDGGTWSPVDAGPGLPPGAARGLWAAGPDTVWIVGDAGRVRRVSPAGVEVMDVPGDDLLAVSGSKADDVWAVGRRGRVAHWNGKVWFDYLPRTRRDLHAVHAADPTRAWAAGDAGAILAWDGLRWQVHAEAEHVDLRGIRAAGAGGATLTGGTHTLVVGPWLRVPRPVNPTQLGGFAGLTLQWDPGDGPVPSFTYLQLTEERGFPFWTLMVDGALNAVTLPDLKAAWGLEALWPGAGYVRLVRATMPGFRMDDWDTTDLNQYLWRAWAQGDYPVTWPEQAH